MSSGELVRRLPTALSGAPKPPPPPVLVACRTRWQYGSAESFSSMQSHADDAHSEAVPKRVR